MCVFVCVCYVCLVGFVCVRVCLSFLRSSGLSFCANLFGPLLCFGLFVCLCLCVFVCLFVCVFVCLFACLFSWFSFLCFFVCAFVCVVC